MRFRLLFTAFSTIGAISASAFLLAISTLLFLHSLSFDVHAQVMEHKPKYLQLKNRLDRPEDGYCFDIPGTGGRYWFTRPIVAHNCKAGAAEDEIVELDNDGRLRFPAFDLCTTAMAAGRMALPGVSLGLATCDLTRHQQFEMSSAGQLRTAGGKLCVVVGPQSATTASPVHRWRPLYLESCELAEPGRSLWAFVDPL